MISQTESGDLIAQMWDKHEEDFDNADANARLIAAAPRMYEQVKELADHFYGTDRGYALAAILRDVEQP